MQPLTAPTVKYSDRVWSIELHADTHTIRVTSLDVQIHTENQIAILPWGELVELITELADVDENETVALVVADPLSWLISRPGVIRSPNTTNGHGFFVRDDYTPGQSYNA